MERPAPAVVVMPGADDLIAGQYADRPHLRPILDAVLAALPAFGPVTVQARRTLVSLVTPRRTFAVVQPTTKSRVDLGLRLDGTAPGGRLLPAKDVGAASLRIALAGPGDVDAEVLGWLRREVQVLNATVADLSSQLRRIGGELLGAARMAERTLVDETDGGHEGEAQAQ